MTRIKHQKDVSTNKHNKTVHMTKEETITAYFLLFMTCVLLIAGTIWIIFR